MDDRTNQLASSASIIVLLNNDPGRWINASKDWNKVIIIAIVIYFCCRCPLETPEKGMSAWPDRWDLRSKKI